MQSFCDLERAIESSCSESTGELTLVCVTEEPLNKGLRKSQHIWRPEENIIIEVPNKDLVNLELPLVDSVLEFLYLLTENVAIIVLCEFAV